MLRKLLIIILVLLLLVGLAGLAVEIVLQTDFPRSFVEKTLRKQTGLGVQIGKLSTGWSGTTGIENLQVTLPLEDDPFLTVSAVDVGHTGLLLLLIGQPLEIRDMEIDGPAVLLRQDAQGIWNVQRAIDVVLANVSQESSGGGAPDLPTLDLTNATVTVQPNGRDAKTFSDVTFKGQPESQVDWSFATELPEVAEIAGRLSVGGLQPHQVQFDIADPTAVSDLFVDLEVELGRIAGQWSGKLASEGPTGHLNIETVFVDNFALAGNTEITMSGQTITARPKTLTVHSVDESTTAITDDSQPLLTIRNGIVVADQQSLSADRIMLSGFDHAAEVNAEWSLIINEGSADAVWQGAVAGVTHQGDASFDLRIPNIGNMELTGNITADGKTPLGDADLIAYLTATGESLNQFTANLTLPEAHWSDAQGELDFNDATMTISRNDSVIELQSLQLQDIDIVQSEASIDLDTNQWSIALELDNWQVPRIINDIVDLNILASGTFESFDFETLHVKNRWLDVNASGSYQPSTVQPLQTKVTLFVSDIHEAYTSVSQLQSMQDNETATPMPSQLRDAINKQLDQPVDASATITHDTPGTLLAELNIFGEVQPLNFDYDGTITATNVSVAEGTFDKIIMPWFGRVTEQQITFDTNDFSVLDGTWNIAGQLQPQEQTASLALQGKEVSLDALVEFFQIPIELTGMLNTTLDVGLDSFSLEGLELTGGWDVSDFSSGQFAAERGSGEFVSKDRDIKLPNVKLTQGSGELTGDIAFNLDEREKVYVDIASTQWPINIEGSPGQVLVDSKIKVVADIIDLTADGMLDIDADLFLNDRNLGRVHVDGSIEKKTVSLQTINGSVLSGNIAGAATIPLDDWLQSQAGISWSGFNLESLIEFVPEVDGLVGTTSGNIMVAPETDNRLPDCLHVQIDGLVENAAFRSVDIGEFEIRAAIDSNRQILESATFNFADGRAELWGSSTMHDEDRYMHLFGTLHELDLNQIAEVGGELERKMPAQIDGQFTIGGYLGMPDRTFGEGRIKITNSDLASIPLIRELYQLASLDFTKPEPKGQGELVFNLEGEALRINSFRYFNRGTEVLGSMVIEEVRTLGESPIDGGAAVTFRPLKDFDLPLMPDVDEIFGALQGDAVSAKLAGTLAAPSVKAAPLGGLGNKFNNMIESAVK